MRVKGQSWLYAVGDCARTMALAQVADRVISLGSGRIAEIRVNEQPAAPEAIVW